MAYNWDNHNNYDCQGQTLAPLKEPELTPNQVSKINVLSETENLPVILDRALSKFEVQIATLAEIKKYQELKVDVNKPETIKVVKKAKQVVRDLRLKIQRREKELNADLNKAKKELKTDAGSIKREIKTTEDHLAVEIKKDTVHKLRLAEKARVKEAARVKKIDENVKILEGHCEAGMVDGLTAEQIAEKLKVLETTKIPKDIFGERYQDACNLLNHAIDTIQNKLKARKTFEAEQAQRKKELAKLKKQQEINDQVSWFNQVFGFDGTVEGMEIGLDRLEKMEPADYLSEIIEQQKIQGQEIIVKARAAKAESDRIQAEKDQADADLKYLKDWDAAITFNNNFSVKKADDEKKKTQAKGLEETKTVSKEEKPAPLPKVSTNKKNNYLSSQIANIENRLATCDEISKSKYDEGLALYLSNEKISAVIMVEDDGLISVLDEIKAKLNSRIKELKNEIICNQK